MLHSKDRLGAVAEALGEATPLAGKRLRRKSRNRRVLRSALFVGPLAALALPQSRSWIMERVRRGKDAAASLPGKGGLPTFEGRTTIEEQIEVDVPVSTAYNQWTQFEEFPLFMQGVDDVRQLDDERLHWVASIGGSRAEWDAKILEQVPDQRIVWESTDGEQVQGTVSFQPLGPNRAQIRLAMAYMPKGLGQKLGAAAGLDTRRVRGDLERFKELIESRGAEDGAWRGTIEDGVTQG